jgi:hypothetical protein
MKQLAIVMLAALGCGQPQGSMLDGGIDGDGNGGDGGTGDGTEGTADAPLDGPPIASCPVGTWCIESAPIAPTMLSAVHAINADDVFAVGDGGAILRRQNGSWSAMASGTTQNLRGVWGSSSSDVWAVGQAGTVLRFNGTAWSPVAGVLNIDYTAVSGSSATDVWIVGTSRFQRWNGASWSVNSIAGTLLGVSGTGPNNIWIGSEAVYLKHYTSSWMTVMPGGGTDFYAVKAISPTNVWASTPGTGTVHYNGTSWAQVATPGAVFVGFHALSATDIWGVSQAKTGHWDGIAWTITQPAGVTNSLWGVSGAGADVWAVGSDSMIVHRH